MGLAFYTANYSPRHLVTIRVGAYLVDVFEEGVFPLPMLGMQYADRKMLIRDVVQDGTRRKLTKCCGTQLDYPLEIHPTMAGVGLIPTSP